MKRSLIGLTCVGLLASCTPNDLNSTLDRTCGAMDTAYSVFLAATTSGEISDRKIEQVQNVYTSTRVLCDTDVVNVSDAVIRVTLAIATITRTYKEIK